MGFLFACSDAVCIQRHVDDDNRRPTADVPRITPTGMPIFSFAAIAEGLERNNFV